MKTLVLVLLMAVVAVLVWMVWKPYIQSPKRKVPEGQASLYFFYTDWCGWSQKAMPQWELLESKLASSPVFGTTRVKAVRVNAETDRSTSLLYEVEGFPTILLETSKGLFRYECARTAEALLQFLRETLGKERASL